MISTALPSQPQKNPTPVKFDRLALEGNVDPEVVQTILDQWER
jgi:hypothetical protein